MDKLLYDQKTDLLLPDLLIACLTYIHMVEKKDLQKETLKPITKVKSEQDKELQELEVESTGGGEGAGGGG